MRTRLAHRPSWASLSAAPHSKAPSSRPHQDGPVSIEPLLRHSLALSSDKAKQVARYIPSDVDANANESDGVSSTRGYGNKTLGTPLPIGGGSSPDRTAGKDCRLLTDAPDAVLSSKTLLDSDEDLVDEDEDLEFDSSSNDNGHTSDVHDDSAEITTTVKSVNTSTATVGIDNGNDEGQESPFPRPTPKEYLPSAVEKIFKPEVSCSGVRVSSPRLMPEELPAPASLAISNSNKTGPVPPIIRSAAKVPPLLPMPKELPTPTSVSKEDNVSPKADSAAMVPSPRPRASPTPASIGIGNGNKMIPLPLAHSTVMAPSPHPLPKEPPSYSEGNSARHSDCLCETKNATGMQGNEPHMKTHGLVTHNYQDQFFELPDGQACEVNSDVESLFPFKLHFALDRISEDDLCYICSWLPHGHAFRVHNRRLFEWIILQNPRYFGRALNYESFQRQLDLYDFKKLAHGGYYHEYFLRGREHLFYLIYRKVVKGKDSREPFVPCTEPNPYLMPPSEGDITTVVRADKADNKPVKKLSGDGMEGRKRKFSEVMNSVAVGKPMRMPHRGKRLAPYPPRMDRGPGPTAQWHMSAPTLGEQDLAVVESLGSLHRENVVGQRSCSKARLPLLAPFSIGLDVPDTMSKPSSLPKRNHQLGGVFGGAQVSHSNAQPVRNAVGKAVAVCETERFPTPRFTQQNAVTGPPRSCVTDETVGGAARSPSAKNVCSLKISPGKPLSLVTDATQGGVISEDANKKPVMEDKSKEVQSETKNKSNQQQKSTKSAACLHSNDKNKDTQSTGDNRKHGGTCAKKASPTTPLPACASLENSGPPPALRESTSPPQQKDPSLPSHFSLPPNATFPVPSKKNSKSRSKYVPRALVAHNYCDRSRELPNGSEGASRGGVQHVFPVKLYHALEGMANDGLSHICSWQPHGRAFKLHRRQDFEIHSAKYFDRRMKFESIQRQLNLYGFGRLTQGRDKGAYYHEYFLKGRGYLCYRIVRFRVKGTGARLGTNPDAEPDFYSMPPVTYSCEPTRSHSIKVAQVSGAAAKEHRGSLITVTNSDVAEAASAMTSIGRTAQSPPTRIDKRTHYEAQQPRVAPEFQMVPPKHGLQPVSIAALPIGRTESCYHSPAVPNGKAWWRTAAPGPNLGETSSPVALSRNDIPAEIRAESSNSRTVAAAMMLLGSMATSKQQEGAAATKVGSGGAQASLHAQGPEFKPPIRTQRDISEMQSFAGRPVICSDPKAANVTYRHILLDPLIEAASKASRENKQRSTSIHTINVNALDHFVHFS